MTPDQHLENVARAHKAWAASRDRTMGLDNERVRAIIAARDAGCSLSQIAAIVQVDRSYIWQLCQD